MSSIFVISQVYIKPNTDPLFDSKVETRGYWFSINDAKDFTLSTGWWWEEYYTDITKGNDIYFVIEEIDEGFTPNCKEIEWFHLEIVENIVRPISCSKPDCIKQLVHFGMS